MTVLDAPALDHSSGMCHRQEPVLVQAFIPKRSVEAFRMPILDRLTGKLSRSCPFSTSWHVPDTARCESKLQHLAAFDDAKPPMPLNESLDAFRDGWPVASAF